MTDLDSLLADHGVRVVEEFELPSRPARHLPVPALYRDSAVGGFLAETVAGTKGLWSHQSLALERAASGQNVVISTGTASGKSLVFRSLAFHRVLQEPDLRVAVFYPLKALAADQLTGWRMQAEALGLPEDTVGRIDGTVPMRDRAAILSSARIVVMTPDVCHAWLMSSLSEAPVRHFLAHLNLVILDEAHTLEGVFGSNFAFLFRRLKVARNVLRRGQAKRLPLQVIAATATILEPASHLEAVTGLPFSSIDEHDDGSPQHERRCMHCSLAADQEQEGLTKLLADLAQKSTDGAFITFIDSRKGVETVAASVGAILRDGGEEAGVLPYRAGFEPADRAVIERRLKRGQLGGVISTSALELGIDIPSLTVGLNVGVPATRKAYRQRLGRVGRACPGTFIIIDEESAFRRFGSTFAEYHEASVEPSYLYLANRFMQFAHARCLVDELDQLGASIAKAKGASNHWPEGFEAVLEAARPGGTRPREFDAIAQLGGDVPQRGYPLRNVGELTLKVARGDGDRGFGELTLAQALRECYPGAIYYHLARPYKVILWRSSGFEALIKVMPQSGLPRTRPRIQTWVNAGLRPGAVLDAHLLRSEMGYLAECEMQITEIVKGFHDPAGNYHAYSDLREKNPAMRERSRIFRTSGVLISIGNDWFASSDNRSFVADLLREFFCRECSVLPQDVGAVATNISVATSERTERRARCIAVFDQTYGSLRLTERLFVDFASFVERMARAAGEAAEDMREKWHEAIDMLRAFHAELEPGEPDPFGGGGDEPEAEWIQVFTPGSVVAYREKGPLCTEVTVEEPAFDRTGAIGYRVQCPGRPGVAPMRRWIAARFLEPPGSDAEWSYCYWNPDTGETREEEEASAGEPREG